MILSLAPHIGAVRPQPQESGFERVLTQDFAVTVADTADYIIGHREMVEMGWGFFNSGLAGLALLAPASGGLSLIPLALLVLSEVGKQVAINKAYEYDRDLTSERDVTERNLSYVSSGIHIALGAMSATAAFSSAPRFATRALDNISSVANRRVLTVLLTLMDASLTARASSQRGANTSEIMNNTGGSYLTTLLLMLGTRV